MSLATLVFDDAVFDGLESTSKEGVFEEMVNAMAGAGRLDRSATDPIVKALLKREAIGSTGIGRGIAVPHAKHESVQGVVAALGRSEKGIEFAALDGEPVYLVFLLLSSERSSDLYLVKLAGFAGLARDEYFPRFLRKAKDSRELEAVLREADIELDARVRESSGGDT